MRCLFSFILTQNGLKVNIPFQVRYTVFRVRKMVYHRIRDLRTDRDLNQQDVADYLGMSQTGYSKYEVGTHDIPTEVLIKLARFYNTSVDYLLGETDNPKRYD